MLQIVVKKPCYYLWGFQCIYIQLIRFTLTNMAFDLFYCVIKLLAYMYTCHVSTELFYDTSCLLLLLIQILLMNSM